MTSAGAKILKGLQDAVAGRLSAATIEGHRFVLASKPTPDPLGAYNDGYSHEALHTTHVLMETFADHVIDSRCTAEFPDVMTAAEKAHEALFDLYQLIGSKM